MECDTSALLVDHADHDPDVPRFMMAHSLGGTAALNMALDFPQETARLAGLVTIGTPLDMMATSRRFSRHRNRVYGRHMLLALFVTEVPSKPTVRGEYSE